ncbi:hypothetical protein OYE22_23315 [Streptomyces sp. 71268]|uniref:hypothetical protein n=1 Tax=Streptomyces sp. 71268 TaxID=3002640 RepID=UPI0023F757B4|nr:hypothetical protein [Streptomyces sp. 71268]WEV27782.1 hypothetical protein OYE22_23315 [Streptomyces sp. 71268]
MSPDLPPRQVFHVNSGHVYGTIGADLHVYRDRGPVYVLAPYRSRAVAPERVPLSQPSRLLNARYEVVAFTGRRRELAKLADWRDGTAARLALTWLHGPGGQGKSRLAARFATESAAANWKVVTATHGAGAVVASTGGDDLRVDGAAGVLLLVDYADRWPVSHLTLLLSNQLLHHDVPTRVLLLARGVSAWPALCGAVERADLGADTADLPLGPLDAGADAPADGGGAGGARGPGARAEMFRTARDSFAAYYRIDPEAIAPPDYLDRSEFGLTLALHMAALVAVDAHARGSGVPHGLPELAAYLLRREHEHWNRLYENRVEGLEYATPTEEMRQAVFAAALTGATGHGAGTAVLRRLEVAEPHRLLADHATCYPSPGGDTVLEPLYPDRLAEDFLALTFPGHGVTGYASAPWAAEAARLLLARDARGEPPAYAARAVTFLASAAAPHRWPHLTDGLAGVLRADPALAVDAGGAALGALAELDLDRALLEAIDGHLPELGQLDLDAGIAPFAERLSALRLATSATPLERARLHLDLGFRLWRAGQRHEALAATERAVTDFRRTDQETELAAALAQASEYAGRVGDRTRSRLAAQEAVDLYRRLAQSDPATHEPGLAVSLAHLGQGLLTEQRGREALRAMDRATEIFQRLVDAHPVAYEPGLAMALANQGSLLWSHRRWDAAREATERAVALFRRLVAPDGGAEGTPAPDAGPAADEGAVPPADGGPDAGGPDAGGPDAEGPDAEGAEGGRPGGGPAAGGPGLGRAVTVDESDLALALSNLGVMYWGARDRTRALATAREAADIYRRVARANPAAFEPELIRVLNDLRSFLFRSERWREGLVVAEEAVGIVRERAADDHAARARLAGLLVRCARGRVRSGLDVHRAEHEVAEAVAHYEHLAAAHPDFAGSLREAREAQREVRDKLQGIPPEPHRDWTAEEHWVTLLGQDEVWQDAQDHRYLLDSMSPRYCRNVERFILSQADAVYELLVRTLRIAPDTLDRGPEESAAQWLRRQPLLVALRRRADGKPARPALCHCGYPIAPDWQHDHCYPGIIVD